MCTRLGSVAKRSCRGEITQDTDLTSQTHSEIKNYLSPCHRQLRCPSPSSLLLKAPVIHWVLTDFSPSTAVPQLWEFRNCSKYLWGSCNSQLGLNLFTFPMLGAPCREVCGTPRSPWTWGETQGFPGLGISVPGWNLLRLNLYYSCFLQESWFSFTHFQDVFSREHNSRANQGLFV